MITLVPPVKGVNHYRGDFERLTYKARLWKISIVDKSYGSRAFAEFALVHPNTEIDSEEGSYHVLFPIEGISITGKHPNFLKILEEELYKSKTGIFCEVTMDKVTIPDICENRYLGITLHIY